MPRSDHGDMQDSSILVVDDDLVNCDVLTRLLGYRGYRVSVVHSGLAALEAVKREAFDLVVLDIMMPGMDGIEVLRRMRRSHNSIDLPVVMLTAFHETERVIEAFREGADDYITRPLDMAVTLLRIEAQLRLRAQARAQLGELHKIGGGPRNRPRLKMHYCPFCTTSLHRTDSRCPACDKAEPHESWPEVGQSPYLWLGRTLGGRYFLEQLIGEGSVGQVYRALDLDLGRDFAVKIIDFGKPPALLQNDLRSRTLLEVEALVRLNNPHVVRLYQVLQLSPQIYALVMDFVRGLTLEQLLQKEGSLSPRVALNIARQVALALHAAHEEGILHRDIKPANIMLERLSTGGRFVRLLDFGIVRMISRPIADHTFCGTPAYASPEQIVGADALDVRSDIYALGATLYHMLAGQAPFGCVETKRTSTPGASSILMILQHHLYTPPPQLPDSVAVPDGVRGLLENLLQRMMAKSIDDRFAHVGELLEAFERITPRICTEQASNG
ncbi:MAG: response regulator [Myxococcota bacterium]